MRTRVLVGLSVCFAVLILCSACGEKTSSKNDAALPGEDTLAKVKRLGVIKWGADSSGGAPYVFGDPKDANNTIGFEVDMMEKIAAHMGVKPERIQAEWASLKDNMKARRSDIVLNGIE